MEAGLLRVDLNSPPVEGGANRELVEFLADLFGVSRSKVRMLKGERSREKLMLIEGAAAEELQAALDGRKR